MSIGSSNSNYTPLNIPEATVFNEFNNDFKNLNNNTLNSFSAPFLINKSNQKNDFLNYYSENSFGGGISLNKEFSYNFTENSISSSASFSPIYV